MVNPAPMARALMTAIMGFSHCHMGKVSFFWTISVGSIGALSESVSKQAAVIG
jgi:hypothetical protein